MEVHSKVTVYVSLFVVWSFNEYACFENLALGKLANQSSFYSNSWDAARAVDGDTRQELFSSSSCAKTGVGQKTASWYVDLGKITSIHHVDIYYRKESDSAYESTYRKFFAGFSLYISNSTNLNNESLCYHRLQNGTNSPPSVMSIQCEMIGRYVTIYNERLPEQTYPEYYSSTAELELCEVEVYGCQGISQYGDYCLTCPATCPDARCNMFTGSCFQCLDGFTGDNCTESTTVRLVGGLTEYQGRLEVYYNETWGTVYQSYYYYYYYRPDVYKNMAAVVCRSLGLPWITSEGYCCSRYGHGSGPVWLADVQCLGNETKIEECSHSGWVDSWYMYHWEDVSIDCLPNTNPVRLVGGSTVYEGRVEVYRNGVWGTVCDNLWDDQNSAVVCTSMGFSSEGAEALYGQPFGRGTGPVYMNGVECQGNESSILQCNHRGWENQDCDHSRDVSVNCTSFRSVTTRLAGGPTPYEGRVEVYRNGSWGTVSDRDLIWNDASTRVVCRSLGYLWDNATVYRLYQPGSGPIHICNVQCNGTETDLTECWQYDDGYHIIDCYHYHDIYVKCNSGIDECAEQPCQNNGTCVDLMNDYTCNCMDGFNGTDCTNNINDCQPDPCENNGTCIDLVNDYRCDCVAGFNGTLCENNIDECNVRPCQNNGTCVDLINDYQCYCIDGFNDKNCTNNINDCLQDPCQHNGTCTDLVNDYQCDCVEGFNGTNCENNINDCIPEPCQNNGTCIDLIHDYQCYCTQGFNGTTCTNSVEVLPPSFVQGTLSQGAMESLAKLKEKYPTNIGHKPVSKKRTSESKVMESDEEMPKIELQKPSSKCGGKSLSKISTMQSNDVVESDEEMPKIRLQKPSSKCGGKSLPKISTMQSDDVVESDEEMPKIRLQKPSSKCGGKSLPKMSAMQSDDSSKCGGKSLPKMSAMQSDDSSKCGGKSLPKMSAMQSDDVVESDEEMPNMRLQKPSSKCCGKSLPKMSAMQSDDSSKCGGKSLSKISTMQSNDIVESDVELPKVPIPVVESDVELPQVSLPSSKCSGENMPLGRKIKSSTMQSDDLPDLCSSKEESPCIKEDELMDREVEKFFDLMDKKIKRKTMADEYEIRFPKEGKRITIVYEVHGGMALSRPFDTDDTMLSVFTFACQEINPEILPPSFYFECVSTESCMFANCQHSFKLEECHGINIRDIPDVLLLKEAEYSLDDTLTNYGDVHLRGSVGPVFH